MEWVKDILLMPFKETIVSLLAVIVYALLFLCLNWLMPQFKQWTRLFFMLAMLATTMQPVLRAFEMMQKIADGMMSFYGALYPLLMSTMVMSSGVMSVMSLNPLLFVLIQFAVFLTGNWLIPILTACLLFDFLTRFMPELSFSRLADFLRGLVLSIVSATVMGYSMFLVVNGVMAVSYTGELMGPLKRIVQQNIPIIGSIITESLSTFRKYSSATVTLTSTSLLVGIWGVAVLPTLRILMTALSFRFLAAILEPFAEKEISQFIDDIGKTLFILCAVSFILAFAFFITAVMAVLIVRFQIQER